MRRPELTSCASGSSADSQSREAACNSARSGHVPEHHTLEVGEVAVEGRAAESRDLHDVLDRQVAERPDLEQILGGVEDRLLGGRTTLLRGGADPGARRRHTLPRGLML